MLFNLMDFAIFLPIVFMLYWFVFSKNNYEFGLNEENERFIKDISALGKLHNFNDDKSIISKRDNFTDPSHFNKQIETEIY